MEEKDVQRLLDMLYGMIDEAQRAELNRTSAAEESPKVPEDAQ